MLDRFRTSLEESGLIPDGTRVLVAYSGGPDSTCLLHLLHSLGIDVLAAHLHHGMRDEADEELLQCEKLCDALGVPFVSGRADVPMISKEMKIGIEEAGRRARYAFLEQAARKYECPLIATAHTRTDHVETVILNLTRGSGLSGLAGIPRERDNIIRPLLGFSRDETQAYCRTHELWTHQDPANMDTAFSRSRIRMNVLPELRHLNHAAEANISRLADIVREEDGFLNGMAAAALEQSEWPLNGELAFLTSDIEVAFLRDRLTSLPAVLLKRSIRLAVEAVGGSLDHHQTNAAVDGLARDGKGAVSSDGGEVAVEWDDAVIHIRRLLPTSPYRYLLTIPGETDSEEFGWRFVAFPSSGPCATSGRKDLEVNLDPKRIRGQLYFRTVSTGDKMSPVGFEGHRALSDLLSEAKLTLAARQRLPIVCDMLGPIWAPGVSIDGRAAATSTSDATLTLRFESM